VDVVAAVEEAADERRADEAAGSGDHHRLPLPFPSRHLPEPEVSHLSRRLFTDLVSVVVDWWECLRV
jgi:hypothetical protein